MSELKSFPGTKTEALALLYLQSRKNLAEMTPTEIADEYDKAYYEIAKRPRKTPTVHPGGTSF